MMGRKRRSPRHGTRSRYLAGCRCEPCREAKCAYAREYHARKMRALDPSWTPDRRKARHGTNSKYAMGCRCEACTEAHRRYRTLQSRREGFKARVSSEPSRSLMACMVASGITSKGISGATGCSAVTLALRTETVLARTAERIEKLHWALWRQHVAFRFRCRCEMPGWMRDWLEAA